MTPLPTLALAGCLAGTLATASLQQACAQGPSFAETQWRFAMDQWGLGRAFRCRSDACTGEVGFCNCATGVADDDEIDRVSDFELLGGRVTPVKAGEAVEIGSLKGRAREFVIEGSYGVRRSMITIALAAKCDAVVATITSDRPLEPADTRAAMTFLRSDLVSRWVEASTGLQ
jgi:hypothetical protein